MKIGPLGDEHSWEPSRPAATKIIDTPCSIAAAAIDSTWAKKKKKKKKHMGQKPPEYSLVLHCDTDVKQEGQSTGWPNFLREISWRTANFSID